MHELLKRLAEINARKAEIRNSISTADTTALDGFETELRALEDEQSQLERRKKMLEQINNGGLPANPSPITNPLSRSVDTPEDMNYRTAFFKALQGKSLTAEETRALSSTSTPGVLPTTTTEEIIKKMHDISPLISEITMLHVPGNVTFNVENAFTEGSEHTENALADESDDNLVPVSLAGFEVIKILKISETVRKMSINSFEQWVIENVSDGVVARIENRIVNGTGVGMAKGIEKANTWVDDTNAIAWAGASLAVADLDDAIALLNSGYFARAKFLMSSKTFFKYVNKLRDDAKAPIVAGNKKDGFTVNGFDVVFSAKAAYGTIYLGDLKMYVGNLSDDVAVAASEHSAFTSNSVIYRGTAIFDGKPAIGEAFIKIAATL
jgi:HK97 family phage major capsid protein